MIKIYNYGQVPNEEVFARENISANVEAVVADIIADVRKNGDDALYAYAAKFDKANLTAYAHGEYFELGKKIGSFGFSAAKKKKKPNPTANKSGNSGKKH